MDDLDSKKVIIVTVIVVILIVVMWYNFYYSDASSRIKNLRNDIARLYKFKSQLPVIRVKYKRALKEFKVYSKRLPLKEEIPSLLVKLSAIIKKQGVDLVSFNPGTARLAKNKLYFVKPINISIRSTYVECGNVFEHISKMKRLFKVINFTMSNPKVMSSKEVLIDVNFSAETYYFKGGKK